MITYQNMTPSQTFEERIVSVINTGIDATASKLVCVTNGNLLRYKTDQRWSGSIYIFTIYILINFRWLQLLF